MSFPAGKPDSPAVAQGGTTATYGELDRRAEDLLASWRAAGRPARLAHVVEDAVLTAAAVVAARRADVSLLLLDSAASAAERDSAHALFGVSGVVAPGGVRRTAPDGDLPGPAGLGLRTSGVDGPPKCVERPWETVLANAFAFGEALDLRPDDVSVSTTPPHHSYAAAGGIVTSLVHGAAFVAVERRTGPRGIAEVLDAHRGTLLFSVPLLYRWCSTTGLPARHAPRLCVSAGTALSEEDRSGWRDRVGWRIAEHFGTSEHGMLTVDTAGEGGVGRAIGGVEVAVAADHAVSVRLAGPPARLIGENGAEELTGWRRTGDLGRLDDGVLTLRGRVGSVVNIAGNKVSVTEVETAIRGFGPVVDCAVVGRHGTGAVRLAAYVEAAPEFERRALIAHLRAVLAPYKVPSEVVVVDSLPRGAAGKVLKSKLPS